MIEYSCDKIVRKKRCSKKPYVEVFWHSDKEDSMGFTSHWSYLCFKHFILDLIKNYIFKKGNGYCYVSDKGTLLKRLLDKKDYGKEIE